MATNRLLNHETKRATKRVKTWRTWLRACKPTRMVACSLGCVSVCGLACSLTHMSDAIHACWGSGPTWLAACMAVIIDAGMISCECGEMVARKGSSARAWLRGYMVTACILSSMLNCMGVMLHEGGIVGCILGCLLPWMLLALMRGCVHLWMDE